ncbi:MAG: VOC family protein [Nocardioidaceae bacterium]|nr:VOC family protein [Nocardioidaceae bacterium]
MSTMTTTDLRAAFAHRLSTLYGREVPAYTTLLEVSGEVNQRALRRDPARAERLGSIDRVTAERHGAIRVGTPTELAQVARIFAAMGMYPTGFYDLRDAYPDPIPVVSTAFRPRSREELAVNPFRVFTSLLATGDRRFFDADLERRLKTFLASRRLFGEELLALADRAGAEGGLAEPAAGRFLELAVGSFALSAEPVDRAWYRELEAVSSVAADIGGVRSTHINHLTPRVLDIDDLYRSMTARGIEMIDAIQGPPAWDGPDVLLRQTSFRALAEPRRFLEADGSIGSGSLRVRFGEVEARGIALTPAGRTRYDEVTAAVDGSSEPAAQVWNRMLPTEEAAWREQDLAFFHYDVAPGTPASGRTEARLEDLLRLGLVSATPIVYEDFLPRSAAGIFSSNLTGTGEVDRSQDEAGLDAGWLSDVVGADIAAPEDLYGAEQDRSLDAVRRHLGLA